MAYDISKLTNLSQAKILAEKVKTNYATKNALLELETRVNEIAAAGGEPNVITDIKVNGTSQTITDKVVDIPVPTNISDLNNDSDFQTKSQVSNSIQAAISASGHAHFEEVSEVPAAANAEENVLYLVKNTATGYYDIYALISGSVVRIDDTTVDLTNYVQKDGDKVLSDNNYTDAEKEKLSGIETGANNYTHPESHSATMIVEDSTHRFVTDSEKEVWNGMLSLSGGIMSGSLDMGANTIINIADPQNDNDAANKGYVDNAVTSLSFPIQLVSSNTTNTINIRDLASGTYILSGTFLPYSGSSSSISFYSNLVANIVKDTSTSYVQVFYPVNNMVQYLEITDTTYNRTNICLNDLTDDHINSLIDTKLGTVESALAAI